MKPTNAILTMGDVLRYYSPTQDVKTYYDFMDDKYDLPVLVGLQNEETPHIFDMAENTNLSIAGTTGSGKSWAVFEFLLNLVLQSHPGDVSFIIMDFKREDLYSTFSRLPHVVGFFNHSDAQMYSNYLKEIVLELDRRKELLNRLGVSKWSELRKSLKDCPEELHKFPWLFVILEETASVLSTLDQESKEAKDEFIGLLVSIAKQARSLGVRLMLISQRTIDKELPRNVASECGVKYAFQLLETDLDLVGMKPVGIIPPVKKGIALFKHAGLTSPIIVKTLGAGGLNDVQISNLIWMLAYEWQLRVDYNEIKNNFPTLNLANNCLERRIKVLQDYKDGKMFKEDVKEKDLSAVVQGVNQDLGYEGSYESSYESSYERSVERKEDKIIASGTKKSKVIDLDDIVNDDVDNDVDNGKENKGIAKSLWGIGKEVSIVRDEDKGNLKEVKAKNKQEEVKKYLSYMNNKLDIQSYIREYGDNNRIKKEELFKIYDREEVLEAELNIEIVEDGDYYRA